MNPRVNLYRAMLGGVLIAVAAVSVQGGPSASDLPGQIGYWFGVALGGALFGAGFAKLANSRP